MKILQLSTYPIEEPRHGGQIRVHEIRQKLISLGCEVLSLSISETGHSKYNASKDFIVRTPFNFRRTHLPFCSDYMTSQMAHRNRNIHRFLSRHIQKFIPDVIFCEQPWLWPSIKHLIKNKIITRNKIILVYSSQNVESILKKRLLADHSIDDRLVREISNKIEIIEQDLIDNADKIICVTNKDAAFFGQYTQNKIIICPNGVSRQNIKRADFQNIKNFTRDRPYLFFCGSAYPPNAQGFWEMYADYLPSFPPESMILVAGGVGNILWSYLPANKKMHFQVYRSIVKCTGMVSDDTLSSLIECSNGIALPITYGGGSNLKTAEAIASLKPVVATSTACRGYDFVDQLNNFYIAKNQQDFANVSRDVLLNRIEFKDNTEEELRLRSSVFWKNTLKPLKNVINEAQKKLNLL